MPNREVFVALLVAIVVLAGFARLVRLPYPVVLVCGGLAMGLLPGVPTVRLDPDLVFFVFLPPLVYSAAFLLVSPQLRDDVAAIGLLAVGLVLATMVAVAVVAHAALGLGWAPAFLLGAILGPTDPVSATAVLERLGAPPRIATILEGEALVNDGTGLVAYKIALGAVTGAGITAPHAAGEFLLVALGGAAVGLLVGAVSAGVRRMIDEPRIEITVSLLTPFAAFIPADEIGVSGVLAAVTAGLYVGARSLAIHSAETRLRYEAFWDVVTFILNSLLFLLIGLELPDVLDALAGQSHGKLVLDAALVTATVIGLRAAWMLTVTPLFDALFATARERTWGFRAVLAWSSMRGGVSLAAALAVPLTVNGVPFADRSLLLFLTFVVVVVTLVLPALTLPHVVERAGLATRDVEDAQEARARRVLAETALERLDELAAPGEAPDDTLVAARTLYTARLRQATGDGDPAADLDGHRRVRGELIAVQREALARLRVERAVGPDLARRLQRELDLEEARLA
jgi:Na+/H+ antiporter